MMLCVPVVSGVVVAFSVANPSFRVWLDCQR